jgi:hypothetical protein
MLQKKYFPIALAFIAMFSVVSVGICAPVSVPFDGGISLFLGAGIAVAVKKMFFK